LSGEYQSLSAFPTGRKTLRYKQQIDPLFSWFRPLCV
jgi:hypothetical protein